MSDIIPADTLAALDDVRLVDDDRVTYIYNGAITEPIRVQVLSSLDGRLLDPKTRRTIIMGNDPVMGTRLPVDKYEEFLAQVDEAKKLSESEHTLMLLFMEVIDGEAAVNEGRATQDIVDDMVNDRLKLMLTMHHA